MPLPSALHRVPTGRRALRPVGAAALSGIAAPDGSRTPPQTETRRGHPNVKAPAPPRWTRGGNWLLPPQVSCNWISKGLLSLGPNPVSVKSGQPQGYPFSDTVATSVRRGPLLFGSDVPYLNPQGVCFDQLIESLMESFTCAKQHVRTHRVSIDILPTVQYDTQGRPRLGLLKNSSNLFQSIQSNPYKHPIQVIPIGTTKMPPRPPEHIQVTSALKQVSLTVCLIYHSLSLLIEWQSPLTLPRARAACTNQDR